MTDFQGNSVNSFSRRGTRAIIKFQDIASEPLRHGRPGMAGQYVSLRSPES